MYFNAISKITNIVGITLLFIKLQIDSINVNVMSTCYTFVPTPAKKIKI
jgi:hypothetical protein